MPGYSRSSEIYDVKSGDMYKFECSKSNHKTVSFFLS